MARRRSTSRATERLLGGLVLLPFKICFAAYRAARKPAPVNRVNTRVVRAELRSAKKNIKEAREILALMQMEALLNAVVDENEQMKKELGR